MASFGDRNVLVRDEFPERREKDSREASQWLGVSLVSCSRQERFQVVVAYPINYIQTSLFLYIKYCFLVDLIKVQQRIPYQFPKILLFATKISKRKTHEVDRTSDWLPSCLQIDCCGSLCIYLMQELINNQQKKQKEESSIQNQPNIMLLLKCHLLQFRMENNKSSGETAISSLNQTAIGSMCTTCQLVSNRNEKEPFNSSQMYIICLNGHSLCGECILQLQERNGQQFPCPVDGTPTFSRYQMPSWHSSEQELYLIKHQKKMMRVLQNQIIVLEDALAHSQAQKKIIQLPVSQVKEPDEDSKLKKVGNILIGIDIAMSMIMLSAGVLQIVWLQVSQNGLEMALKLMFYNVWILLLLHFQFYILWKEQNWKQVLIRWALLPLWLLLPYFQLPLNSLQAYKSLDITKDIRWLQFRPPTGYSFMLMLVKPAIFIILYAISSNRDDLSVLAGSAVSLSIVEIMCWIAQNMRINSNPSHSKYQHKTVNTYFQH